uniref:Uncharacterized protein n=1 Tax=Salix viminalis TaxID=40686 RepID=A0A6N2LYC6_SALVM
MKPNKIGECGVDRKFPSHVVLCIYSTIGPHAPSSSIEGVRCSIASVVIILKLNGVIIEDSRKMNHNRALCYREEGKVAVNPRLQGW